jgi:hypothetical protein
MCLSPKDVKKHETSAPVDPILSFHKYKRSNCTLNDVKKKAYEMFDTIEHLEYYDTEQDTWCSINDLPNNESFPTLYKGRILNLRIPEYYDSFVIGDMYDESIHDDDFGFDYNSSGLNMTGDDIFDLHQTDRDWSANQATTTTTTNPNDRRHHSRTTTSSPEYVMEKLIRSLLKHLREDRYVRSKIKPSTLHNIDTQDEVFTKEWVLRQCNTSDQLRAAILGNANAVNHIVQCLHYDFLWKDVK